MALNAHDLAHRARRKIDRDGHVVDGRFGLRVHPSFDVLKVMVRMGRVRPRARSSRASGGGRAPAEEPTRPVRAEDASRAGPRRPSEEGGLMRSRPRRREQAPEPSADLDAEPIEPRRATSTLGSFSPRPRTSSVTPRPSSNGLSATATLDPTRRSWRNARGARGAERFKRHAETHADEGYRCPTPGPVHHVTHHRRRPHDRRPRHTDR